MFAIFNTKHEGVLIKHSSLGTIVNWQLRLHGVIQLKWVTMVSYLDTILNIVHIWKFFGNLLHYGNFLNITFHEEVRKYCQQNLL